jgi:hypothetical protein
MAKSQLSKFAEENVKYGLDSVTKGTVGKIFGAAIIADIATADNKLKAVAKALKDILLMKPMMAALGVTMFAGMRNGIMSLLKDTGSLDQALRKLAQIQGLQAVFTPLVGGANAAKLKVAELTAFAARFNKTLEETGQASRSLTVMTRGAYSGAEALKTIGDAAAGTGNSLETTADAMGMLFDTLRSGNSIAGVVENMRQMGLVSQGAANELVTLQQNGATAMSVFASAQGSLNQFSGAMDRVKESIDGANAAHEVAIKNLQEKFASPFVAADVQNTKNMTAVFTALAPTVERVAVVFNILIGGMTSTVTWVLKLAAQFPPLQVAIQAIASAIGLLVTVLGVWGAINLGRWFLTLIPLCKALNGEIVLLTFRAVAATSGITFLSRALAFVGMTAARVVPVLAALGAAVGVAFAAFSAATIIIGVIKGVYDAIKAHQQAEQDLIDAAKEHNAQMEKQIANIKTLTDYHEALTVALQEQAKAQDDLNEAIAAGGDENVAKARKAKQEADARVNEVKDKGVKDLAPSDEEQAQVKAKIESDIAIKENAWQMEFEQASPEKKATMRAEKIKELEDKQNTGEIGNKARIDAANIEPLMAEALRPQQEEADRLKQKAGESQGKVEYLKRARQQEIDNGHWQAVGSFDKSIAELTPQAEEDKAASDKAQKQLKIEKERTMKGYYESLPENTSVRKEYETRETLGGSDYFKRGVIDKNTGRSRTETTQEAVKRQQAEKEAALINEGKAQGPDQRSRIENLKKTDPIAAAEQEHATAMQAIDTDRANSKAVGYQKAIEEVEFNRRAAEADYALVVQKGKITGTEDENKRKAAAAAYEQSFKEKELLVAQQQATEGVADSEKKKASITATGYERKKQESDLQMDIYNKQLSYEEKIAAKSGDYTKVKEIRGQMNTLKTQAADDYRENVRSQITNQNEAGMQTAQLKGDVNAANRIGDYSVFEQRRSANEQSGMGREEAMQEASKFAAGAVSLDARKEGADVRSATAATELARVGGGGNTGAGNDMIDIARRQEELQKQIAENTKKEGGTAQGIPMY